MIRISALPASVAVTYTVSRLRLTAFWLHCYDVISSAPENKHRRPNTNTSGCVKPKFHYADFPVTSETSPRQTCDVPFSPNYVTPTSRNFPRRESFRKVGVTEVALKGTSRVCRGRHEEVSIVEFGLYQAASDFDFDDSLMY